MSLLCQRLGSVGQVSGGGIRDLQDIAKLHYPVFALGTVATTTTFHIAATNIPVVVGGMRVNPGDLIHGDQNGVIRVPLELAARAVEAAKRILEGEKEYCDFIRHPDFTLAGYEQYMNSQK